MKLSIQESPYKSATKDEVCSHLKPVLTELENNGNMRINGIISDRSDGNIMLVNKKRTRLLHPVLY